MLGSSLIFVYIFYIISKSCIKSLPSFLTWHSTHRHIGNWSPFVLITQLPLSYPNFRINPVIIVGGCFYGNRVTIYGRKRYRILIWEGFLQQENNPAATGKVNYYVDYNSWKVCGHMHILKNIGVGLINNTSKEKEGPLLRSLMEGSDQGAAW